MKSLDLDDCVLAYVGNAQDELPSGVQRELLLAALHAEDVDFSQVAAGGDVLGVGGEGHRPGVHWQQHGHRVRRLHGQQGADRRNWPPSTQANAAC